MKDQVQAVIAKIKELVRQGNVSRIVIRKGDSELMSIPVNIGIIGGVVTLATGKWLLIAGVLATVGFGCRVEIVKTDGTVVSVMDEADTRRILCDATDPDSFVEDSVNFEDVVSSFEPSEATEPTEPEKSDGGEK